MALYEGKNAFIATDQNRRTVIEGPDVDLVTSQSVDQSKVVTYSPRRRQNVNQKKFKFDNLPPDYDVEYDDVKLLNDDYTASASETFEKSYNRATIKHDGLPGFPPPKGIKTSLDMNSKAELAAQGAGFLLDKTQTSIDSVQLIKAPDVESNDASKIDYQSLPDNTKANFQKQVSNPLPIKYELKRLPIIVDPMLDTSSSLNGETMAKNPLTNQSPIYLKLNLKNSLPNLGQSAVASNGPKKENAHSLESAIRLLGLPHDETLHSKGSLSSLSTMPLSLRALLAQNSKRKKRSLLYGENDDFYNESIKTDLKRINKSNKSSNVEPTVSSSRYFPYNDNVPFRRENSENEHNNDDDEKENDGLSKLFNFDDLSNRFAPILASQRQNNDQNSEQSYYPQNDHRKGHNNKYGILGSGNFEIIRGGIYSDDESASNNVPNYVSGMQHDERKKPKLKPHYERQRASENTNENGQRNNFGPHNDEFFSGNPVLGFQGYDNFGASDNNDSNKQRRHDGYSDYFGHPIFPPHHHHHHHDHHHHENHDNLDHDHQHHDHQHHNHQHHNHHHGHHYIDHHHHHNHDDHHHDTSASSNMITISKAQDLEAVS